ncbi:multi-drug export protein [Pontimonas salivibrio]|uniref:Multi-drug export protein n=1 Tax=Pontimonas salivibrio TaxID=1159327 RepID=A0A2L2BNP9_9MICO|nr:small multi-drug export protein [Pontimonas salivibrio]AVG23242.1 multi-drug export protein [Pontimonas salivibrio]
MASEFLLEQLGLLGVFIAGATPWLEAVVVIPVGIAFGLSPVWTMVWALVGNASTIVLFALLSDNIMARLARRRERKGLSREPDARMERAKRIFTRYGVFGMAVVGPLIIGTQIAAAIAVSLGVSVWRSSTIVTLGAVVWGVATGVITWAIVA